MITARVFQADVGRVKLYLLDPDTPETPPEYRLICDYLYNRVWTYELHKKYCWCRGHKTSQRAEYRTGLVHLNEGIQHLQLLNA